MQTETGKRHPPGIVPEGNAAKTRNAVGRAMDQKAVQVVVAPTEGMLLIRATLELRDGSRYPGFVTPASEKSDLGTQQPQMFIGTRRFSF